MKIKCMQIDNIDNVKRISKQFKGYGFYKEFHPLFRIVKAEINLGVKSIDFDCKV